MYIYIAAPTVKYYYIIVVTTPGGRGGSLKRVTDETACTRTRAV